MPNSFEYHVSPSGKDSNDGGVNTPLKTIQAAADRARPGDTVTVHEGIYRERVDPPHGGISDDKRIVYRAAPGERVRIKGSEPMRGWEQAGSNLWKVTLPNEYFGDFNPYKEMLGGHWFIDNGRNHHPGSVYLDGHWLLEASSLESIQQDTAEEPRWFGQVDENHTILWAEFPSIYPNENDVEICVRQTVFYPSKPDINYLTVSGFELLHAATPWAPPTTEQIGLIGTNWGKGWIIENNRIAYSACSGLTLGKYDDPEDFGDRPLVEFTQGEDTFHGTIQRALKHGWSLESTGGHVVRGNHVSHCEMAGICGSLGAVKSIIEENTVHDIHTRRLFNGHEQAGIKFHAPIDSLIRKNRIYNCPKGFWMDWMTQGTRITQNLCYRNGPDADLYLEANHGPCVVDNNLFLSDWSISNASEGTLFAHNLFAGTFKRRPILDRTTPFHKAHSTDIMKYCEIKGGDDRLFGNIFTSLTDLDEYATHSEHPNKLKGNLLKGGGCKILVSENFAEIELPDSSSIIPEAVQYESLDNTVVSCLPYLDYNGKELNLSLDFFGRVRNNEPPAIGPFEIKTGNVLRISLSPDVS